MARTSLSLWRLTQTFLQLAEVINSPTPFFEYPCLTFLLQRNVKTFIYDAGLQWANWYE